MTKEKAKYLAEVLKAYAEGKTIEVLLDGGWREVNLDEYSLDAENEHYRIKKEPKYRPFRSAKECFEEMQKHQPVGWLRRGDAFAQFVSIGDETIRFLTGLVLFDNYYEFKEVLDNGITFADGQPFGIKEH